LDLVALRRRAASGEPGATPARILLSNRSSMSRHPASPRPGSVPPPLPANLPRRRRGSQPGVHGGLTADSTIPLDLADLMLELGADERGPTEPAQPCAMSEELAEAHAPRRAAS
jgi:hypothetical protein